MNLAGTIGADNRPGLIRALQVICFCSTCVILVTGSVMGQVARSNQALRGTTPGPTVTVVRRFLHWPSRTLSWTRSTPASVGIHYGRPGRTAVACFGF